MPPYAEWLQVLSWAYLSVSFLCAAIIIIDELPRPQKMGIMNLVGPITALYFGPAALWGYFRSGLKMTKQRHRQIQQGLQTELQRERGARPNQMNQSAPTREQVVVADTHCGAGWALGGLGAEWWVFAAGLTFADGAVDG